MQLSGLKLAGMIMVFNGRYVSGKPELNLNQSLGSDAFLARSGIILHGKITQTNVMERMFDHE